MYNPKVTKFKDLLETKLVNIIAIINELQLNSDQIDFSYELENLRNYIDFFNTKDFKILVLGEFNRGKSSFINRLLNIKDTSLLTTSIMRCTAFPTIIKFNHNEKVSLFLKNNNQEDVSISKYKKLVDIDEENSKTKDITKAEIYCNSAFLENNIILVDTPGLNDNNSFDDLTLSYINDSSLIIFILSAIEQFNLSERLFFEEHIKDKGIPVFFIANKWDLINMGALDEVEKATGSNKVKNQFNSKLSEYVIEDGKNKFHKRFFPISLKKPEESEYNEFKTNLDNYIKTESVIIKLLCLNNTMKNIISKLNFIKNIDNTVKNNPIIFKLEDLINKIFDDISLNTPLINELKILKDYYDGDINFNSEEKEDLLSITGEYGISCEARLGLTEASTIRDMIKISMQKIKLWSSKANEFCIPPSYKNAAKLITRSYENIYYHLNCLENDNGKIFLKLNAFLRDNNYIQRLKSVEENKKKFLFIFARKPGYQDIIKQIETEIINIIGISDNIQLELKFLVDYYSGKLVFDTKEDEEDFLNLIGEKGTSLESRLGIENNLFINEMIDLTKNKVNKWNKKMNEHCISPMQKNAYRLISRYYEAIYFNLHFIQR